MITLEELKKKATKIVKLQAKKENIFIDYSMMIVKKEAELMNDCKSYLELYDDHYKQIAEKKLSSFYETAMLNSK